MLQCYSEFNDNTGITKTLNDHLEEVEKNITYLNNCPSKFQKSYDALNQMYADLYEFENLATSPKGNFISYKNEISSLDNKITNEFNVFKTQLPNGIQ